MSDDLIEIGVIRLSGEFNGPQGIASYKTASFDVEKWRELVCGVKPRFCQNCNRKINAHTERCPYCRAQQRKAKEAR